TERRDHASVYRRNATGRLGSPEEPLCELLPSHIEVRRHVTEDTSQRTDAQGVVRRDRHVVLAALGGREPHVAAGLPCDPIADVLERPGERDAGHVARQLHAEITSSRTKCRRMTFGDSPASKWQRTASRTCSWMPATVSASAKIDRPSARATYPPSGASSTTKITSSIALGTKGAYQHPSGQSRLGSSATRGIPSPPGRVSNAPAHPPGRHMSATCGHENPPRAKFCLECGASLIRQCS